MTRATRRGCCERGLYYHVGNIAGEPGDWIVERTTGGHVNLSAICRSEDWHLQSTVDRLVADGLHLTDADAFARFAFADRVVASGGVYDCLPEDWTTDEQWDRLTVL